MTVPSGSRRSIGGREIFGLPIQTATLDAAHDVIGYYRLATLRWDMALVMPLNQRNQDHSRFAGSIRLDGSIPICPRRAAHDTLGLLSRPLAHQVALSLGRRHEDARRDHLSALWPGLLWFSLWARRLYLSQGQLSLAHPHPQGQRPLATSC
ncbi:hypothetical protein KFU94_30845 [Chloroflexi bacterium TSY]|nr:hypothetical protein [Chloroflexi bacterium TSY]